MKLVCASLFVAASLSAAEKKVKLESLPPALQASITEQTKGAMLIGITTEKENGKTLYEVATKVNGKTRDMEFDRTGKVVEIEDEIDIESIPAAAKAAIQKHAAGGSITKVEKLTAGSSVSYEAAIKNKAGKTSDFGVNADGSPHKEN